MNDKRFKFFNSHVDFDYVIEINIMLDFIDCAVSRGGDVITYEYVIMVIIILLLLNDKFDFYKIL